MDFQKFTRENICRELEHIVAIDSPTGYNGPILAHLKSFFEERGFEVNLLRRGGLQVCLGGEGHPIMLCSHVDTLGCVVRGVKGSGALRISNMTLNPNNVETECVRVITRENGVYEGTIQLCDASIHVNDDINQARSFDNLEVVLDEVVKNAEDTKKLGIQAGDFIAVDPRFCITEKGFVKSRFLDDKASAAVLMGLADAVASGELTLRRKVWLNFTVFEELGYGGVAGIPEEIEDLLAVDMGCVGSDLTCTEHQVSICAKDSAGPYHYEFVNELIACAKEHGADYAVDIYPHYSSDAQTSVRGGYDVRHAVIGPGVYASHGYERTHIDALVNTFKLVYHLV